VAERVGKSARRRRVVGDLRKRADVVGYGAAPEAAEGRDHVVKSIREMPEIALAMIASTSQHMHHLAQQVEQLKAQTGVQRLAEFLVALCPPDCGKCTIALPYDKTLIAGRLGLKPESLSRAFAKLKPVGVDVHAAHVVVRDPHRLQQLAADDRASMRLALGGGKATNASVTSRKD
jgi:Crp-like helix-turn-helix domain